MSLYSPSRKQYDDHIISKQEQEHIRQLQAQKTYLEQQMTNKFKTMLKNTYQMQDTGCNINENLKGQTQKLQNIKNLSNDTGKLLKKANQTTKQMSSFWYSVGKKIKRIFVKDQQIELQGDYSRRDNDKNETKSDNNDVKHSQFIRCQDKTDNQCHSQPDNKQQDQYLDQLSNQVRKLISMGKSTNEQLTKQTHIIIQIDKKTDHNSAKMQQANKRIKKNFF